MREEYDFQDNIAKKYALARQLFSVDVRGEAVYWMNEAKKKARRNESRGKFVSRAVAFYVRNSPYYNTRGRIAVLEAREKELLANIANLQRIIRENHK
jgi:hypothetical protein